jgi:hypothetical protein
MTTELARSFMDDLDQLPAEIPGAATLEPGRINWYHGVKQAKLPGVFYARETAFTDAPPAPWVLDERYSDQGELGYCAPRLNVAIIGWRDQWFRPGENRGDSSDWLSTYEDGAKKLTEYLIKVQDLDDPMVLSVSGLYKARPIIDLVSAFRRGALTQAMRKTKRQLPLWAFWLPVASRTKDGKVEYLEATDADGKVYGSVVTPPALAGTPAARTVAEIVADGVLWQEFRDAGWFDYKRLPRNTTEGAYSISSVPQLPPGKNVPQALTAAEEAELVL